MATETDAARDRVLAARSALGDEIDALEASARAAVDVPARIRRSPAKAAAIVGSAGFVALGGPKRIFRSARRAVFGPGADLPKQMLPDEIEKTLRKLGDDGDRVRGAIERDFAAYVREAEKVRGIAPLLSTTIAKPLLTRAGRAAAAWFFRPDQEGFQARLDQVRRRARDEVAKRAERPSGDPSVADDEAASGGA